MRALLILLLISLLSPFANAKDLTSRLGVGYSDQFGITEGLTSLNVRYYPSADLGISAALGVDTEKNNSKFGFMAKVFRVVFKEDNMNFFMGAGAGIISREENGTNSSGFELDGFFGGEFFLAGLESLGFIFEAGIGVTSISSQVRFRTIGDSPLRAGMVFYF